MSKYRVGIIGTGRRVLPDGNIRRGIAYQHAPGYLALPDCEIVALADIVPEAAAAYAEHFQISPRCYTDYRAMLAAEQLDIVSVCAWPALHAEMTIAAAASVKAVHCEKPMAPTWGEAQAMARACAERGVQLTFNHQRRFGAPFQRAKALLQDGAIGELLRLEGQCPNLMDWGTHWFDMFFFYNDDTPAEWVLGQIDKRTDKAVFHLLQDDQGIAWVGFANGVQAELRTGHGAERLGASNRLIGSRGILEVGGAEGQSLRLWNDQALGWQTVDVPDGIHGGNAFKAAIADVVSCLSSGAEPLISARRALQPTEVVFATYESSRYRGRIDLPLQPTDSALLTMVEQKLIGPDRTGC
ncbi:MAG: Gfo/Idh/MocA family oxidoreductase [Fimbriimonadaceae bacterium]|nr:Gfo/Idh/MocA family oxidoreductase [Fimbriimonadaceae bacterium]